MLGIDLPRRLTAAMAACCLLSQAVLTGQSLPVPPGGSENLHYTVEWRLINAGTAKIERSGNDLKLRLESAGLVSKLYRIDDTYLVNFQDNLCAVALHLDAQEGRRHRDTRVTFDRTRNRADYLERDLVKNAVVKQTQIDVPHCVHDVAGGLAALRNLRLEPGKSAELPITDGKKYASVRVEAQEREDIKVNNRIFKTIRCEAFLFNGAIYARKARLILWLTEDNGRLPVKMEVRMGFPIGTVTLTLDKEPS